MEEVDDIYRDNCQIDLVRYIAQVASQTRKNIYAVPVRRGYEKCDLDEAGYKAPYEWESYSENSRRRKAMYRLGIRKEDNIQNMHCGEVLKIMGTVDLGEIYKRGKAPTHIRITPSSNATIHDSMSGSGILEEIVFEKEVLRKARFKVDGITGYGIQSVYGFTSDMWKNHLEYETL